MAQMWIMEIYNEFLCSHFVLQFHVFIFFFPLCPYSNIILNICPFWHTGLCCPACPLLTCMSPKGLWLILTPEMEVNGDGGLNETHLGHTGFPPSPPCRCTAMLFHRCRADSRGRAHTGHSSLPATLVCIWNREKEGSRTIQDCL